MQKLAVLVCVTSLYGCVDGLVCEEGTIEVDGLCRIAEGPVDDARCGRGTHLEGLVCVPDLPPTECDEDSTISVVDINGVTICIGSVPPGCAGPIACPSPTGGMISICGQILDLETRQQIDSGGGSARCDPDNPTQDGPCALRIEFFDALAFAANPTGDPLNVEDIVIDECGRFRATNVDLPFNKSIGIAVDDISGDERALTGVALFGESGERRTGVNAYSTAHTTDQKWTDTGNPPFAPQTYSERGVLVALFEYDGEPVQGVRVTAGGTPHADDDDYFADQDIQLTTVDASLNSTGPNGAALLVGSNLGEHGGIGGEVGDCSWESALAVSIPGVVFVQEKQLVDALSEPCAE